MTARYSNTPKLTRHRIILFRFDSLSECLGSVRQNDFSQHHEGVSKNRKEFIGVSHTPWTSTSSRLLIAPLRPTYSRVSPVFLTWHADDGCGLLYFTSSGRSARSSLYSRQADVSGFWCRRLERPASPHRICAVTRSFQRTTQDLSVFRLLPRH